MTSVLPILHINFWTCVLTTESNLPAHLPSLIRVFTVGSVSQVYKVLQVDSKDQKKCADAQSDWSCC